MSKKYIDIFLSILFIVLSVLLYRSTASFPKSALFTTAIYIKFLSISLFISSLFMLFFAFKTEITQKVEFTKDPKKFFILVLSLIVYVWIMQYIGFIASTILFLISTMRFMGHNNFIKSVIISLLVTGFVYLLFVKIFEIQLPEATLAIFGALQ